MTDKGRKPVQWELAEPTQADGGQAEPIAGRVSADPAAAVAPAVPGSSLGEGQGMAATAKTAPEGGAAAGIHVDVAFRITGTALPLDHGYVLFAAVSRAVAIPHGRRQWGVHPVLGRQTAPGVLALTGQSRLKIRLPAEELTSLLPLTGVTIDVDGQPVKVGVPEVLPLRPSASLKARFVTVKGFVEPEPFAAALRRQLADVPGLGEDPGRIEIVVGPRRVMRVASHTVVGFAVGLDGLEAAASLAIQVHGLGGRRHMGAGIFVPAARTAA